MTQPNDKVLREIVKKIPRDGYSYDEAVIAEILSWHSRQCEEMFEGFEATIKELRKQHRQLTAELEQAKKEIERVRGITVEDIVKRLANLMPPSVWERYVVIIATSIHALINQKGEK